MTIPWDVWAMLIVAIFAAWGISPQARDSRSGIVLILGALICCFGMMFLAYAGT